MELLGYLIEELGALVDFVVDVSSLFSNLKLGIRNFPANTTVVREMP